MYKATLPSGNTFAINLDANGISSNDAPLDIDITPLGNGRFHLVYQHASHEAELVAVNAEEKTVSLKINGNTYPVKLQDKLDLLLDSLGMADLAANKANDIKAPMPGLIHDIKVAEGDTVEKGQPVLVLEAMKMENIIKAPGEGTVKGIAVKQGDSVEKGQILIQF